VIQYKGIVEERGETLDLLVIGILSRSKEEEMQMLAINKNNSIK
jgi:hypothetical protein